MSDEVLTYESTKAKRSTEKHPDRIHWDNHAAYRDSPYRQLHHQHGVIGTFRVRLLEAAELQRHYWSALALGPVRLLGLSKAHGAVSSFCSLQLEFHDKAATSTTTHAIPNRLGGDDLERKPAAKGSSEPHNNTNSTAVRSPVVPRDNHPVWDNCQFEFVLHKGVCEDGTRIVLNVRVDEASTTVENLLPGSQEDARLLGIGQVDLTDLCLGETTLGQALPGIRDAWIPLALPKRDAAEEKEVDNNAPMYSKDDPLAPPSTTTTTKGNKKTTESSSPVSAGRVRVLVSYQPHGLEPQPKDIIALECFARRNPKTSSCRPLLPPLLPLTVLERRGAYLLAEYTLPTLTDSHVSSSHHKRARKACVRLHRNAVFVIERKSLVDSVQNLALLPVDVVLSTPIGQATLSMVGPLVAASRELLMPAVLSWKLLWLAARTTALAGFSGVQALGSTLWSESALGLTAGFYGEQTNKGETRQQRRRESNSSHAQFASL